MVYCLKTVVHKVRLSDVPLSFICMHCVRFEKKDAADANLLEQKTEQIVNTPEKWNFFCPKSIT